MHFPERPKQHVLETDSYKIVSGCFPSEWIIRNVTERDYGVDLYLEIVVGQEVRGHLCSLQIKSKDGIGWSASGKATLSRIKTSTVNYWLRSPVLVFILWVDCQERVAYYLPVKAYFRENFASFNKGRKTDSFRFDKMLKIQTDSDIAQFLYFYCAEKDRTQFEAKARSLFVRVKESWEFLVHNLGSDLHMPLDERDELYLTHLYETLKFLANYQQINWNVPSLPDVYQRDRDLFQDPYSGLHFYSFDFLVEPLLPIFLEVTAETASSIESQSAYWTAHDLALLTFCINIHQELRPMREMYQKILDEQ